MTDICLVLEGTYPYKMGGVATWTDHLVRGLPEFSFSVAHLYYGQKPARLKFPIPQNLRNVVLIPLNKTTTTVTMQNLVDMLPESKLYHSLSTGIAGLLGTEAKLRKRIPFVLTEHGIYWHEIALGVDELECGFKIVQTERGDLLLGQTWTDWNQAFRDLACRAYETADIITTVCSFNQSLQRSLGADASRSFIVPNGTTMPRNGHPRSIKREMNSSLQVAIVARVSPIKDIKTFLRASAIVQQRIPNASFLVIGPTDHDPVYTKECLDLVTALCLRNVTFTGETNVEYYYPTTDIAVLTSVSEAQPLAILEAFAHGVPVVTTDVGGLPELVNGNCQSDSPAGILCSVANPEQIAEGILRLAGDDALYRKYAETARARIESSYPVEAVTDSYRRIYRQFLAEGS